MKTALLSILALACVAWQPRTEVSSPVINVIVWFDTEDYILPRSDDAAKRIAEILTRLGVPGTFKVVGEKARVLEQRGRADVIAALRKHEIGYHTDMHSRQPTMAVYLQHAGWEDGKAEFLRREGQGLRDVERIFGTRVLCFGQPGSSWAPQAYPALVELGVPVYLDEAGHVGIDNQPFYFGGMLNIFNMRSTCTRLELGKPDNMTKAKADFQRVVEALRSRGGGTISVYYHPCEFVHADFWDGVNFSHGANPPRNEWKLPPTQSEQQIEKNFSDFEKYVAFVRDQPGVRFVRAADLVKRYADDSYERPFTRAEVAQIAAATSGGIAFRKVGNTSISGADTFSLLTSALVSLAEKQQLPESLKALRLYGPARAFERAAGPAAPSVVQWSAFAAAARETSDYCRKFGRIPAEIWIGTAAISPEDYLVSCAAVVEKGTVPGSVQILTGSLTAEKYVAKDDVSLWNWPIFPVGFHAPGLMELARLQAWTLKPAILH
jgi:hypothetical protein